MKFSLHEKMMQTHSATDSNQNGMPKDIISYEVALKKKTQIAEETYLFTFEKPKEFTYKAGQHARVTLINPPETDDEGNSRFLSFASTPQEPDITFAMRMRDTAFKRVLGKMQIGEKVLMQMRLQSPHGSFALQDAANAGKPAVFLIGGIGIVPAFSMIKDAIEKKQEHKIVLFYANRRLEDAPFLEDLQKLAKENPSLFTLVAIMTQAEKSTKKWDGETGHITKSLIEKYINDLQAPIYYIAGLTEMVNAMQAVLKDAGIDKSNIRAEEFGAFTMAHAGEDKKRSINENIQTNYTCSMHPEIHEDKPGVCPKCGMKLIEASSLSQNKNMDNAMNSKSYLPLIIIIGLIFLTSLTLAYKDALNNIFSLSRFLSFFMIGFFLTFSGFKLMDIKGFAEGYSTYDLLAKKWTAYGYVYPFIELFFGLAMILTPQSQTLLIAEFLIMVFSGIGVALKLAKHERFQCACLGTFLKVPLTKVTLIEDFGMALLALVMLVIK